MKLIYKRMLTVALALSAAVSSAVIAYAEGSRELTKIDSSIISTDTVQQYPAYRPYLDWRDRSQFGMASKNVVYAYANQGETISNTATGDVTVYSKNGRGYKVADLSNESVTLFGKTYSGKRIGLYSQKYATEKSFKDTLDENDAATDSTHSAVGFVPQHNNSSVEIVWTRGSDNEDATLNAYTGGTVTELGKITTGGLDEPAKATLTGLKKNQPVYIYAASGYPRIYEIDYHAYEADTLQQVSENTTWNNFATTSYTETSLVTGYDTLRVYADENNKVEYNSGHAGEIDFRGIGNFTDSKPTSRVLEINPKKTGIVEVGFSGGGSGSPRKLVIEQNGVIKGYAIRNTGCCRRNSQIVLHYPYSSFFPLLNFLTLINFYNKKEQKLNVYYMNPCS